ncbi:MAG: hypothetical protein V4627_08610 [Pseudomonadota bacterium]
MKAVFTVRAYACGVLMLCAAMGSAALTLGRAQGAVFVGKPLDLRVQVQFDSTEDAQAACMDAEVFYGDVPLDTSKIAVTLEPGGARGPTVRVTSSVLVNEPIVTVNFRMGCQQKLSKRYTVFPEVATSVVEAPAPQLPPRIAAADVPVPVVVAAPPVRPALPPQTERPPKRARTVPVESLAAPPPAAAPPAVRSRPVAKASGKSRLKLDPLDLMIERDPVLQATTELLTLPQENAALRAEAAALWRSLNLSPEELLLQEAKTRAFEKDLKALYAVTADNQKGLMDLVAKVERAESERYANGLVYALAALCLASLLALAWVWRRARAARTVHWQDGLDNGDSLIAELAQAPPEPGPRAPSPVVAPVSAPSRKPAAAPAFEPAVEPAPAMPDPMMELDLDLDSVQPAPPAPAPTEQRVRRPLAEAVGAPTTGRDMLNSVAGGLRAIDSTELLDVRKQASFFMSLGQVQQAIEVLTTRIAQAGESSPLVCLDLLKIYYKEGREPEYEALRHEFNNWFTGRVPAIDDFGNEGRALEKYPKVIDQIVALWPDPRVLEYIENCIYHHSSDVYEPDFDLLAYRELLLLHGVAKRIVRTADDDSDSHAAGLVRIAARAPSADSAFDTLSGDLGHRVGAQHRGAWKRNPVRATKPPEKDPQVDVETRGAPLDDPSTDINFLDLR